MGKVGVFSHKGLNGGVGRTLPSDRVLNTLHSQQFRHFGFDAAETRATRCKGTTDEVEGADFGIGREIVVICVPAIAGSGRYAGRLSLGLHHILSPYQADKQHSIVGSLGTLRVQHRVGVFFSIELKDCIGIAVRPFKPSAHTAASTRAVTGRSGCKLQFDFGSFFGSYLRGHPRNGAKPSVAINFHAYIKPFVIRACREFDFHR